MSLVYFDYCQKLERQLRVEEPLMEQASQWIAEMIHLGGRLQIFADRSLSGTAFDFFQQLPQEIPGFFIKNPANGRYEQLEGAGTPVIEEIVCQSEDVFLMLSNEGRNPASIELAQWIKQKGCRLILVTGFDLSRSLKSKHSSGLRLFEYADLILDNYAQLEDKVLLLPQKNTAVCGTTAISTMLLLQQILFFTMEKL
ncbi:MULTISPECIES: SIS domain-containing protein [unclassified Enterococcus]|jgi:uncharacterized phosphosugar-binding protein|uniref:SIS domain-containing protein n=1 Tax=unclassified Enterococcus TaxID=2608891 RepID=UPI003D2C0F15